MLSFERAVGRSIRKGGLIGKRAGPLPPAPCLHAPEDLSEAFSRWWRGPEVHPSTSTLHVSIYLPFSLHSMLPETEKQASLPNPEGKRREGEKAEREPGLTLETQIEGETETAGGLGVESKRRSESLKRETQNVERCNVVISFLRRGNCF